LNIRDREKMLLSVYTPRQTAVLICLAMGKNLSETAREVGVSRSTIYRLLEKSEFCTDLLEEQRYLVSVGIIEYRCLAYRRKILKAVVRHFSKVEGAQSRLDKFEKYLDKIDQQTGMDRTP